MKKEQALSIIAKYRLELEKKGVNSKSYYLDLHMFYDSDDHYDNAIGHCLWMFVEMEKFLESEAEVSDKFHRWLGFVQGILWTTGIYTIDEMRNDNRPI